MNINLPFDYSSNIDDVNIVLMNNALERIGNVNCLNNFNCILNYNSANEISFDVYKSINDIECKYWKSIYDLKNVFVEELNEVYKIYVSIDDSDYTVKHVIGRSLCEDELSNIKLYDIQINTASDILRDDYTTPTIFYSDNHKNSLLNRILEKAPHYSIEHVDSSLAKLQYTFEFDECSIYDALIEIGQKIGCIFKFNSLKRTISAYDLKNYCVDCNKRFDEKEDVCPYCNSSNIIKGDGNDTIISISKDSIATMTSLDNDEDSYINCLRIKTGDEMIDATVRNINPNGSEYIYYFNEDIINDMPKELVDKINDYNEQNDYYNKEYVFELNDNSLKEEYNLLVAKYNGDIYKNYKYNEDEEKELTNNSFISIENNIIGFEKIIGLYYDNIDFQLYLESNLMPYVLQEDVSIEEDIKNLTVSNLSPISLSELSSYTSVSTIEIYIKKYTSLYLKNSYIVEVTTQEYDFEGGREDGWNYGSWTGKIKLTEYGSEKKSLETSVLTLEINDNYQKFLDEKILTSLRSNDDEIGSIYNIMSIKDDTEFKNALKLYSLSRLVSFEDAYQSGVDIMIEADQANASADFYQDIYVPLYNKLQYIKSERSLRENEIAIIERTQQRIEETKANIQESLNFEYYIGNDLWKIFCTYKREDVFTNDNITSEGLNNTEIIELARETINNAQENLKEIGYLQKNIVCSLKNFLGMKEFETYKEDFNLGNWIVCENDEVLFKQRLISINISISNEVNISVDLSQVTRTEDELKDIKSVLNQASSLGASIGEIKNSIVQASDNSNIISSWIKDGLDLTNTKIVSTAKNQDIVYNKNGILVRSYDDITETYSPEQLKIVNSTIAITKNNWDSIETAIGRIVYIDPKTKEAKYDYGVNAKLLVGKLILGESLGIYSDDGNASMSFDNNGLVLNAKKSSSNQYNKIIDIQIDGKSCFYISRDGELIIDTSQINDKIDKTGVILAINQSTETIKIKAGKITLEGIVTANNNFKILTDGSMEAINGKFSGSVTATSGKIGIWSIGSYALQNIYQSGVADAGRVGLSPGMNDSGTGMSYSNGLCFWAGATWSNSLGRVDFANAPFRVRANGGLYATNATIKGTITGSTITGSTITGSTFKVQGSKTYNVSLSDVNKIRNSLQGKYNPTSQEMLNWDVDNSGELSASDMLYVERMANGTISKTFSTEVDISMENNIPRILLRQYNSQKTFSTKLSYGSLVTETVSATRINASLSVTASNVYIGNKDLMYVIGIADYTDAFNKSGKYMGVSPAWLDSKQAFSSSVDYIEFSGDIKAGMNLRLRTGSGNYLSNSYIFHDNSAGYLCLGAGDGFIDSYGGRLYLDFKSAGDSYDMYVRPRSNGKTTLGSSTYRYYNVYLTHSPNVSSDKRMKKDFSYFDERYIKLFEMIKPLTYQLKSSPEGKSRLGGFIAQDIENAMIECDIDKREFGLVKHDLESDDYALIYDMFIPLSYYYIQTKMEEFNNYKDDTEKRIKCLEEELKGVKGNEIK